MKKGKTCIGIYPDAGKNSEIGRIKTKNGYFNDPL